MSTAHHTPIAAGAPADAATFNAPLSELDAAIDAIDATLVAAGGLAPTTLTATASGGATSITVASAAGFVVGSYVDVALDSGALHTSTVTNIAGNVITIADALPSQASTGKIVSQVPAEVALARTEARHGGRLRAPTLPDALGWGLEPIFNIRAYGAVADGASHPLSDYYATLPAAQADYPHATALTDEIDWCATQAAVNACRDAGTGWVWIGDGTLRHNQTLTLAPGVRLRGGGRGRSRIDYYGSGVAILMDGTSETTSNRLRGVEIEGITISNQATGTSAIRCIAMHFLNLRHIHVTAGATRWSVAGIEIDGINSSNGSFNNILFQIDVQAAEYGYYIRNTANETWIWGCRANNCTYGVRIASTDGVKLFGLNAASIQTSGGSADGHGVYLEDSGAGVYSFGSRFETMAACYSHPGSGAIVSVGDILSSNAGTHFLNRSTSQNDYSVVTTFPRRTTNNKLVVQGGIRSKGELTTGYRTSGSTSVTFASTDCIVAPDTISVTPTVSLPAANSVPAGFIAIIKDMAGNAGTRNITVVAQGADTIDGASSTTITTNYGRLILVCDGVSKWGVLLKV